MKEDIFFVIDGKELFLDKVLVEYNEAPIFFVCRNEKNYFISSCTDIEKECYIVVKVSLSNLSKMLHGKMTMRGLILLANKFWDIRVGEDETKDIIVENNISAISLDSLPYEGAYLKIATPDLENYVEKIDFVLYGEGIWENKTSEMFEYAEMDILDFMEQYKVHMQYNYEYVIKNINKICLNNNYCREAYNKNISSSEVKINKEMEATNITMVNENGYLFAA